MVKLLGLEPSLTFQGTSVIHWLFVESASQIGGISIGTGVEQQRKVEAGTDINIIFCSHLMCQLIRMRQAHPAIDILIYGLSP